MPRRRIEDIERRKEECPRSACRVEHRHAFDRPPKCHQQFRPFGVFDHVLGELADIEVEGDKLVDGTDPARCQFFPYLLTTLSPGNDLAPYLRGEGILGGCWPVPSLAALNESRFPLCRVLPQSPAAAAIETALINRRIDIPVRIFA